MEFDDVHSQFLIAVADACQSAATASFAIELQLATGERLAGVPGPMRLDIAGTQLDATGYADEVRINGATVPLHGVIACTILAPARLSAAASG